MRDCYTFFELCALCANRIRLLLLAALFMYGEKLLLIVVGGVDGDGVGSHRVSAIPLIATSRTGARTFSTHKLRNRTTSVYPSRGPQSSCSRFVRVCVACLCNHHQQCLSFVANAIDLPNAATTKYLVLSSVLGSKLKTGTEMSACPSNDAIRN